MTLPAWVLAAMLSLAPGRDHVRLAEAIATRAEVDAPLFADDDDRRKTAALLVAIAFRESSFVPDAIGDHGRSHCAGQIYLAPGARTIEGWTGEDLRDDADKCLFVTMRMLRASLTACRSLPVHDRMAVYARGSCASDRGKQLSRDRMALAKRLLRDVDAGGDS